jgi:hypothetical protein
VNCTQPSGVPFVRICQCNEGFAPEGPQFLTGDKPSATCSSKYGGGRRGGRREVGGGRWEVGEGRWEVGSGRWEVGGGRCR